MRPHYQASPSHLGIQDPARWLLPGAFPILEAVGDGLWGDVPEAAWQ